MVTKIAMAIMATLVLGLASTATITAANAQSRHQDSGYSYGEAPNEVARDRACATGCGGD